MSLGTSRTVAGANVGYSGRTLTQCPLSFLSASNLTTSQDRSFLCDSLLRALYRVAFHYSTYRALTSILGMDGNLQVAYDVGQNFVSS